MEGGTLVTIEGSNLGQRREDIEGKVSVGNFPCALVEYHVSVRIVCKTGKAQEPMAAPVIVGNNAGYTKSPVEYNYRVSSSKSKCSHKIFLIS